MIYPTIQAEPVRSYMKRGGESERVTYTYLYTNFVIILERNTNTNKRMFNNRGRQQGSLNGSTHQQLKVPCI